MSALDLEKSIRSLRSHVDANPADYEAKHDLAVLLGQVGHVREALTVARQVSEQAPEFAEGWLNLGNLEALAGDKQNAIAALENACAQSPNDPRCWFNLGNLQAQIHQVGDSIESFTKARDLAPREPSILASLALAYRRHGKLGPAIETYEAALTLQPENTWVHSNLLVTRQYSLGETDETLFQPHVEWGKKHGKIEDLPRPSFAIDKKRLRIGYVSGDFRRHPVGSFLKGCLTTHDRANFESVCFSDTRSKDDVTSHIESLADEWLETSDLGRDAFCQRVKDAEIDILVDLSGHFRHSRLPAFALRLAPVQATWAGYVGTTGVPTMDWLIADPIHAPDGYEAYASERVIRLPNNYICYSPPEELPQIETLPFDKNGHITFGCFNNLAKVNNAVLELWANILNAVPDSALLLKTADLGQPDIQARITDQFTRHGIDQNRIRLEGPSPQPDLLATYNQIDVALDPFPYSGGLTTLESLLMGVPVLTKTGATFAGRHSTAHLNTVGLTDWIAEDEDAYKQRAIIKVQDIEQLRALRKSLREQLLSSPLCDPHTFTRGLEQAYKEMWSKLGERHGGTRIIDIPRHP